MYHGSKVKALIINILKIFPVSDFSTSSLLGCYVLGGEVRLFQASLIRRDIDLALTY